MKKIAHVLLLSIILMLAGCSDDNDTSTGGDSADVSDNGGAVATDSGGLLLVEVQDQATVNSVINLRYTVRNSAGEDQAGTLFWDDNTSSRVRGNGSLNHIYRAPGTYRIAIQPDGEERAVVATVVVTQPEDFVVLVGDWEATYDFRIDSGFDFRINADGSVNFRNVPGIETCEGRITFFELEPDADGDSPFQIDTCPFFAGYNEADDVITGIFVIGFQDPDQQFTAIRR